MGKIASKKANQLQNSFSAFVETRRLAGFIDDENFLPAFASSSAQILPYQIAAARFALRSPYLKGCILCDEGSLGKTFEALLIASQKWYEGADRLIVVLPQNLVKQWCEKIENNFTLPYFVWNSGEIPDEDGLLIVTYDFAVKNTDKIGEKVWDLIIFDEADFLFKPQNKSVEALKAACGNSFKLLLTPTPITLSIMDIYGLIHFIDETVLPNADWFYRRYFRKPENYGELTNWVSLYCFRTLKSQVTQYANFTKRVPLTVNYSLESYEKALYELTDKYLTFEQKWAYPQMDKFDLTLLFYRTLSSSPQAFAAMLDAPIGRAEAGERELLQEIQTLAKNIEVNSKTLRLLKILKPVFAHLKKQKLPQKAIVFVENLTTLNALNDVFTKHGYNSLKCKDVEDLKRFREDKAVQILVTTDAFAKGIDIEYCPVVVNYDPLYNAIEMEQRICRCHRQGQKSDVLVVNLLSEENFADVRIFELINKRTLQFSGIFGMSDGILGNFDAPLDEVLVQIRHADEVKADFKQNLQAHRAENEQIVSNAEDMLFTTFTKSVADKVVVAPKYIEEKIEELNADLWEVIKHYFVKRKDYEIDEEAKTITCTAPTPPHLFYYWSGSQNRPYTGLKQYGLGKDFKPHYGRISYTSPLVRGIFSQVKCFDGGEIIVDADIEPCEIGYYKIYINKQPEKSKPMSLEEFMQSLNSQTPPFKDFRHSTEILAGRTGSGKILNDEQCRKLLNLSVLKCAEQGKEAAYWLRAVTDDDQFRTFESAVQTQEIVKKYVDDRKLAVAEELECIKLRVANKKNSLEHELHDLRLEIKNLSKAASSNDKFVELKKQKQIKLLEKELRQKEQTMHLEKMKIDTAAKEEIEALTSTDKFSVQTKFMFVVRLKGKSQV